jgi:hypothetical protein
MAAGFVSLNMFAGVAFAMAVTSGCGGRTSQDTLSNGGKSWAGSGGQSTSSNFAGYGGSGSGGMSQITSGGAGSSGSSPTAGAAGCATRTERYSYGVKFVYQNANETGYPDCVPTCEVVPDYSVEALPAGPCTVEPACAMLATWVCPTFCSGGGSAGANVFLCTCVSGRWSCNIAH